MSRTRSVSEIILDMAARIAAEDPTFSFRKGPGKNAGNGATAKFIKSLNDDVQAKFLDQVEINKRVIAGAKFNFDFYVASERCAIEIALSARNIVTEVEKDIFKAILANENNLTVDRLMIVGKVGTIKRHSAPGPRAIREWVQKKCGIRVEIGEFSEPGSGITFG